MADHDLGIDWTPGAPTRPGLHRLHIAGCHIDAAVWCDDGGALWFASPDLVGAFMVDDAEHVGGIRRHAPIPDARAVREAVARECVALADAECCRMSARAEAEHPHPSIAHGFAAGASSVAGAIRARFGLDGAPQLDPRVWHLARSPGVRWCGAGYPNLCTTDDPVRATCPACFEARAQGLQPDVVEMGAEVARLRAELQDARDVARAWHQRVLEVCDALGIEIHEHAEVTEVARLREALRGVRAFCGRVSSALSPNARPDLGDPTPAAVRDQAQRVAAAIGRVLGDGDDFGDVVAAHEALAALTQETDDA